MRRTIKLDEVGDLQAPPGSRSWAIAVRGEIDAALHNVETNADYLDHMTKVMERERGYVALGFTSFEQFCAAPRKDNGLGKTKIAINIEIDQRKITQTMAEQAKPLAGQGGDRKTYEFQVDNHQLEIRMDGTNPRYLTARIARDRPDILEEMKQGAYKSVRAAAIAAGIIDPDKTRRLQMPADPIAAGLYLAGRVDEEWMMTCYDAFMQALGANK